MSGAEPRTRFPLNPERESKNNVWSLPKRTSVTEEKREKHNNDGGSEAGRRKKKAKELERPESCRTMKRRDAEREGEGGK